MAPLRTALIGLSRTASVSWASVAHLPYLLSPLGRQKYQITALCNSSIESARASIAHFNLPPTTKPYGDPALLAADPDIDLVVCNVRVDKHYALIRPAVEAGKAVFCEWPLAKDMDEVMELVSLAREKGGRTMVGIQGRMSPVVRKMRELVGEGEIGRILSVEVRASGGTEDRVVLKDFMDYFADRKVGGNLVTIGFGHLMDSVQMAVGDWKEGVGKGARLQLMRPEVPILERKGGKVLETVKSDVPDLIYVCGELEEGKLVRKGATLAVRMRRGQPYPGEPPLVWTILGEKGEVRLVSTGGSALNATAYSKPLTIEVHDFDTDEVRTVEWKWEDWQEELPLVARNVGALYEAFAEGDESGYPTFEDALKRHGQLDEIMAGWKPERELNSKI